MNDQDIIRKAVELADGWSYQPIDFVWVHQHGSDEPYSLEVQWVLDALAAQLVRQVDKNTEIELVVYPDEAIINDHETTFYSIGGKSRTMVTLRAIVESGVLENE